jgi:predicted nucleic acid-binding protein
MDRVFLDANVLVSAALKPDARLRVLWELADVRLLASPHVVEEARRNVAEPDARERLEMLLVAVVVLPSEPADHAIEGEYGLPPKDRPVLLGALAANAGFLLTGDITHVGSMMGREIAGVVVVLPGTYLTERGLR